jgi:hypothetical protein
MILWLQQWYLDRCDGVWEHQFGVAIGTLDNPGWSLTVDLTGTPLQGRSMDRVAVERGKSDWMSCWIEADRFQGRGDPRKLEAIIGEFKRFAEMCLP